MRLLLAENADPTFQGDSFCNNCLYAAAEKGHADVVEILLDAGLPPMIEGGPLKHPIMTASELGFASVVRLLLERGAHADFHEAGTWDNCLYAAAEKERTEVVQLLLDAGVPPMTPGGPLKFPVMTASDLGYAPIVRLLLDKGATLDFQGAGTHDNCLYGAAVGSFDEVVKILLEAGMSPNIKGGPMGYPLIAACYFGENVDAAKNLAVVDMLLEKGADATQEFETDVPGRKLTPIISTLNADVMRALLSKGADMNAHSGNLLNPLGQGIIMEKVEAVRFLLEQGASTGLVHPEWGNALAVAGSYPNTEIFEEIASHADINAADDIIGTAMNVAAAKNMKYLDILLVRGARTDIAHWRHGTPFMSACFPNDIRESSN